MVLLVSNALAAVEFTLSDPKVNVPIGGSVQVILTALDNGNPIPDMELFVNEYCTEKADPDYRCNPGDDYSPSELSVSVSAKTDVNGHAIVTISHDGSDKFGFYHYTICDFSTGNCGEAAAAVTGDAYVPEFTAIGAGLALIGAGLFANKIRKN